MQDALLYQMMGLGSAVYIILPTALLAAVGLYAMLRMRDARQEAHDPHLGLKFVLHAMTTLALIVSVIGANIVIVDWFTSGSNFFLTEQKRAGLGMFMGGALTAAVHGYILYARTNNRSWPQIRRLFAGLNLGAGGLGVLVGLVGTFVAVLNPNKSQFLDDTTFTFMATCLVWGLFWAAQFFLLHRAVNQSNLPWEDGRCGACGYDMKAAVEGGAQRCSECGEAVPMYASKE